MPMGHYAQQWGIGALRRTVLKALTMEHALEYEKEGFVVVAFSPGVCAPFLTLPYFPFPIPLSLPPLLPTLSKKGGIIGVMD